MTEIPSNRFPDRSRVGWWLFVAGLAILAGYLAYAFLGLLVVGVFGYYATRPICRRLSGVFDSDGLAAGVTVLVVLVPIVVVTLFAGLQLVQAAQQFLASTSDPLGVVASYFNLEALPGEQRRTLASLFGNPRQFVTNPRATIRAVLQSGLAAVSALLSTLLFLGLAVTLSYFLLQNDDAIAAGLIQLFGGRETTAYGYAAAVDEDLETVFFGNLLFVVAMSLVAAAAYGLTNFLAPGGLRVPMVFVLAFLTGVASLIPIVVGKLVYLPVVGYLALQAVGQEGNQLVFVGGVLAVYVVVLDLLPQTFLQPYLTGRHLDTMVLMFGYLLGPILFGWYGFFLLPIVFIVLLEAIRIPIPELVRGDPLTPTASLGESIGTDPQEFSEVPAGDADGESGEDPAADTE